MTKDEKVQKITKYLDKKGIHYDIYDDVAEPGYDRGPMLCSDWNKVSKKFISFVEKNINTDWDDEWTYCSDCYEAIRVVGNCYGWEPSYVTVNCDLICRECAKECVEDIIEEYLNDSNRALPSWFSYLEEEGFICYSPDEYCKVFETGFHSGQNADPKKIAKDIEKELPNHDYIFIIRDIGQFDINWSVMLRNN